MIRTERPDLLALTSWGKKVVISNYRHTRPAMPFVTVKPTFQVTIPAKLRGGIGLHEGDIVEATIVGEGILLCPLDVVDRNAAADRLASNFAAAGVSSGDSGRSEREIMNDAIADIADARRERLNHETRRSSSTATFRFRPPGLTASTARSSTPFTTLWTVGSPLDIGASLDEPYERLAIVEQHAVSQHPVVVVGQDFARGTGGDELQRTGDRCLVVDPVSGGVLLGKKHGLVTRNRKRERAISESPACDAGIVQSHEVVPVSR